MLTIELLQVLNLNLLQSKYVNEAVLYCIPLNIPGSHQDGQAKHLKVGVATNIIIIDGDNIKVSNIYG